MGNAVRREKSAAKKSAGMEQAGARGPMKKGTFLAGLAKKSPKSKSKDDDKDQSVQSKKGEEDEKKTDVEKEEEEEALQAAQGKEEAEDKEKSKNAQAPQTPKEKEEPPIPDEKILQRESKKLLRKLTRLSKQKRLNKRRAWKMIKAITEIWQAYMAQGLKPESRIVRRQAAVILKITKQPLQHWFDRPMKTGKVTKRAVKKINMYLKTPRNVGKADKTASDPK